MNKGGKKEKKDERELFWLRRRGGARGYKCTETGGNEMGNAVKVSIGIVCYICVLVLCTGAVPAGFSKKIANSEVGNGQ